MGNKSRETDVDNSGMVEWTEHCDGDPFEALAHQQSTGYRVDKVLATVVYDML